jgi:hypothetical protein
MTEPQPETLDFRRTPDGVEITLRKPPLLKNGKRRFTIAALVSLGVVAVAALPPIALSLYGDDPSITVMFPFVALMAGAGILLTELNWDRQAGVVSVTNGTLKILLDPLAPPRQWPVKNVATVSAWIYDNIWELKVELKEGNPFRAFKGRRRLELEWIAGLLRAALAPPRPVEDEKASIAVGGHCQICGSAMVERLVYCAKCGTPHHEECWTYNGACSTYGCRESRMTRTA